MSVSLLILLSEKRNLETIIKNGRRKGRRRKKGREKKRKAKTKGKKKKKKKFMYVHCTFTGFVFLCDMVKQQKGFITIFIHLSYKTLMVLYV